MAEENLETCILRENENILYLQGLPTPEQQVTQQILQVLIEGFTMPAEQDSAAIVRTEVTYLD